jgi:ribosomal-protein-alanine N-acetyltransferase
MGLKSQTPAPRDVMPGDVADLARLHARCFPFEPWDQAALARLIALPAARARLIETPQGEKLGFLLAQLAGGEGEILTLCVDENSRRRGIARALLADLANIAREAQSARLVLEVAADNGPALQLYETAGFMPIGRRPGYYRRFQAGAADAVMLARIL